MDASEYGDRGECAVCGVPLDRPPQPEGPQFCDEHDIEDLCKKAKNEDHEEPVQGAFERGLR